jgi:Flp pilus assembly protein TadG
VANQKTQQRPRRRRARGERGNALVEFGLVAPLLLWIVLVSFDAGLYMYSFICVQSAARAGAIRNSGGTESAVDQANACAIAKDQLQGLPSIAAATGSCTTSPLVVTSVLCSGSGACGSASSSADGTAATLVIVRYTLPSLFAIPLTGPPVVAAASQMKLRSIE